MSERDIDKIIAIVTEATPSVEVSQWPKIHPADDDGLWFFKMPGIGTHIQIESSFGTCPFIIETDEFCCSEAKQGNTIDEVVKIVLDYLEFLRHGRGDTK